MALHTPGALTPPAESGDYPLIAVVGPTASGKSALALFLAQELGGEIINYDSVQVFRGLNIGSGKVPPEARLKIPHHLLDITVPGRVFTAGDFRRVALASLVGVRSRGHIPILAGGTGLYLRALLNGLFEGPARSEKLRERLRTIVLRHPEGFLHRLLARLDPAAAGRIHPNDTPKLIRAIEVCVLARHPISAMHAGGRPSLSGFRVLKLGLQPDRSALYERIDRRTEWMFHAGILGEAQALARKRTDAMSGQRADALALGYRQAWAVLHGKETCEAAIRDTQNATRHYAKRQLTWFRREPDVAWFTGFGDDAAIQQNVLGWLRPLLAPRFRSGGLPNPTMERTLPE